MEQLLGVLKFYKQLIKLLNIELFSFSAFFCFSEICIHLIVIEFNIKIR